MNRKDRRALLREQHQYVQQLPAKLTPVPADQFPNISPLPVKAWVSKEYLAQLYQEGNAAYPELLRLSVSRSRLGKAGRWQDGITWEELQAIKAEVGFGDWYGVEIYPPDQNVINVANLRHIWLLPRPLPIGWIPKR